MNDRSSVAIKSPVAFTALRGRRIFEEICDRIRGELNVGRLAPGDKLPAERELAKQFGASRTAVREAIRSLENAGIVELKTGVKGGAFIREGDPALVTEMMQDMFSLGRIRLDSLTEARVLIQEQVVRVAAARGTEEDFARLEDHIRLEETLTEQGRFEERRLAFAEFYVVLCRATGNEVLNFVVDALTGVTRRVLDRIAPNPRADTLTFQRELVALLRERDGDKAAALMAEHLHILHNHMTNWEMHRGKRPSEASDPVAPSRSIQPAQAEAAESAAASARASAKPRTTSRTRKASSGS